MPTDGDYQRLKTVLIEASAATEEAAGKGDEVTYREVERQQSLRSLAAVVAFLNLDPELRAAGALALLSRVHHTLHDLQSGARPAAAGPSAKRAGRPIGVIADRVRVVLAFALDLWVVEGGADTDQAATKLAKEAGNRGVRCNDGSSVTARQLVRWRSDLKCGAAPKTSRQIYGELEEQYRPVRRKVQALPVDLRRADAEQAARRILLNLSNLAPHDAPAARR